MAALKTVKIASDDFESGYLIINESDFDKEKHKLYVEKNAAPKDDKDEAPAPASKAARGAKSDAAS
jgi:hypothetical protein